MNKFLLASISMVASSGAFFAGNSYAAEAAAPEAPAAQTQKADAEHNKPKFLGKTGVMLAPGPVRLDKDGKPAQPTNPHLSPEVRHTKDLQMKADLQALAAGKAPSTDQQRALAHLTPHDRGLVLKRVNEALAAYKG